MTPWVAFLLKPLARWFGVLVLLPSLPCFIYVFVYKLEWGPPGGQGNVPRSRVSPGEFWLEPICRVGLDLPCHPTKDHTVK